MFGVVCENATNRDAVLAKFRDGNVVGDVVRNVGFRPLAQIVDFTLKRVVLAREHHDGKKTDAEQRRKTVA